MENPWRFSVGSFDLLQVKRTNENFTEILRNFEKFAQQLYRNIKEFWKICRASPIPFISRLLRSRFSGLDTLWPQSNKYIQYIYFFTLSLTINTVHIYIAVMWIHMGYNADPDPGSGSASIRIPKSSLKVKIKCHTKLTYKYKIYLLVFIALTSFD